MHASLFILLPVLPLLSTTAHASTILGNPTSGIELVAGADTTVEHIVASYCTTGSQLVSLQATLSKGQSIAFTLTEDTFCTLEVDVRWTPSDPITTLTVDDVDVLKTDGTAGPWGIELDASAGTASFVAM